LPESADRSITSEQVLEVLQTCYDPCCKERSVSVVELGLIQGVKVAENGHDVRIELLLTSGWCPFSTHLLHVKSAGVGDFHMRLSSVRRQTSPTAQKRSSSQWRKA
jgi:metal-sulfur cluster biosynthetic enzyme